MALTYAPFTPSGSTSGKCVVVAATATPGTTFHTSVAGAAAWDEVYVWASNVTAAAQTLTIEWGGTGQANNAVLGLSIPANSPPIPIMTGQRINGTLTLAAFSNAANAINLTVNVNRIS